jgi:hypothetical protein
MWPSIKKVAPDQSESGQSTFISDGVAPSERVPRIDADKIPHDQRPQRWEETDHLAHHMRTERGNSRSSEHSQITIKPM